MKIEFFVRGTPRPQARPFFVKGNARPFSPKSETYNRVVQEAEAFLPSAPIDKPVRLTLRFCFFPARGHSNEIFMTGRPDLDNLEKAVMDALTTARIWTDDRLVVQKVASKVHDELKEGVEIKIETLKNWLEYYY